MTRSPRSRGRCTTSRTPGPCCTTRTATRSTGRTRQHRPGPEVRRCPPRSRLRPVDGPGARGHVHRVPCRPRPRCRAATYSGGTYSGGSVGGSFGACVIARESGGNSQVMNSSGHYGPVPVQRVDLGRPTAVRPPTSATPARPSSTRCSPTPWRGAASPTGPPTTAADQLNPRRPGPAVSAPRGPARPRLYGAA